MQDLGHENTLKCLVKMNRIKKLKSILLLTSISTITSLSAVSCFYNNDRTVKYAREFIKENGFKVKDRVITNNAKLQNFENELYNSKYLSYTFENVGLKYEKDFQISNSHFLTAIGDFVEPVSENILINETKLNNFKENLNQIKSSYIGNNQTHLDLFESNEQIYQKLINDISSLRDKVLEYKNYNLSNNESKKTFSIIAKYKFKESESSDLNKIEREIQRLIPSINNVMYYNITDYSQVITLQQITDIVKNFVKNTPLAIYYQTYLDNLNNPNSAFDPFRKVIEYNKADSSFKISLIDWTISNNIDSTLFNISLDNLNKENEKLSYPQIDGIKSLKTLWTTFKTVSPSYALFPENSDKHLESIRNGIRDGFGPIYLALGINESSQQETDDFKIFSKKLNDKEKEEFLSKPYEFIENNLDILFYISAYNDKKVELDRSKQDLEKEQSSTRRLSLRRTIDRNEKLIAKFESDLLKLTQSINTVKSNEESQSNKNKAQEFIDKFKSDSLVANDIERIKKLIKDGLDTKKTSQFALADLFAKLLFLNKVYQAQSVKGLRVNGNQEELTYWVEFLDAKTNTKKLFDVYGIYKASQLNSNVSIDDYIFDGLSTKFKKLDSSNSMF